MIVIKYKLSFAHSSLGIAIFSWEVEIISTTKTRYFQLKCNFFWHNWEIFWYTNID